jgi:hypothetical protein
VDEGEGEGGGELRELTKEKEEAIKEAVGLSV